MFKLKNDLLLLDIEATGIHVEKHEMIQLAAILLDKKTLKEKASFNSFIKPEHWNTREREAMQVNKISWEQLKNAPSMKTVLKKFIAAFPANATLTNYGGVMDISFLHVAMQRNKISNPFDYHIFNLWPVFYLYMSEHTKLTNKKKRPGFSLEDMVQHFNITVEGERHDALTDCRVEAAILRHVVGLTKTTSSKSRH